MNLPPLHRDEPSFDEKRHPPESRRKVDQNGRHIDIRSMAAVIGVSGAVCTALFALFGFLGIRITGSGDDIRMLQMARERHAEQIVALEQRVGRAESDNAAMLYISCVLLERVAPNEIRPTQCASVPRTVIR